MPKRFASAGIEEIPLFETEEYAKKYAEEHPYSFPISEKMTLYQDEKYQLRNYNMCLIEYTLGNGGRVLIDSHWFHEGYEWCDNECGINLISTDNIHTYQPSEGKKMRLLTLNFRSKPSRNFIARRFWFDLFDAFDSIEPSKLLKFINNFTRIAINVDYSLSNENIYSLIKYFGKGCTATIDIDCTFDKFILTEIALSRRAYCAIQRRKYVLSTY